MKGCWVVVRKVGDEIWEEIKKGRMTGYRMGGTAERVEEGGEAECERDEGGSLFEVFKEFFGGEKEKRGEEEKKMKG